MGYAGVQLQTDAKIVSAQFLPMTNQEGKPINIQDLIAIGPYEKNPGYSAGGVYIQFLNSHGVDTATYTWYDTPERRQGSRVIPAMYGWYKGTEHPDDVTIAPGDGVYLTAPNSDWSLQSNGEVSTKPVAVTLRTDAKMVANPNPVSNDLQRITVVAGYTPISVDPKAGYSAGGVYIQTLNSHGVDTATYTFYDTAERRQGSRVIPAMFGWYKGTDLGDLKVAPGEGLWVTAPNSDWVIQFPAAIETPAAE